MNSVYKHLQGYWSYAQASIGHEYPTLHKACAHEKNSFDHLAGLMQPSL